MKSDDVRNLVARLAADESANAVRAALCEQIVGALQRLGHVLWIGGYFIGGDRVAGTSPFGFGSDAVVGLATVVQIAGELGRGAVALLGEDNRYAASALLRQIVEIEYLAAAFAAGDQAAMEWLHADRDERRRFWTPAAVRRRSGDRFLASDYWQHCDRGGHPTRDGRMLLPDHEPSINAPLLWVELATHLSNVWTSVTAALAASAEVAAGVQVGEEVGKAIAGWRSSDELIAAVYAISDAIRDGRIGPSRPGAGT
jgi:hypothetical protein